MRARHLASALALTASLPLACGGGGTTATTTTTGSGGGSSSSGTGAVGGAGSSSTSSGTGGLGGGCPSALLCGTPAVCCPVGDDCVAGACTAGCPGAVHCNGACCAAGQICLSAACATPGASCTDSVDCSPTEFCEPTLGKCLPQPAGGPSCQVHPTSGPFTPTLKWSWTGSTIKPTYDQLLSVPLVADLDKDGIPEVAIVTHDVGDGACDTGWAYVRLLDGKTGAEKWGAGVAAYSDAGRVAFCRTPALADLDGDGKAEIIAHRFGGGLIAFKADGSILWTSTMSDGTTPYNGYFGWASAVAVADMNGDGKPEIVSGGVILDAQGRLVAGKGKEGAGTNGSPTYGGNSIVADVDGDGTAEILTGAAAYNLDGSVKWLSGGADGYTALADFDGDGKPELVVISGGYARVHDAVTGVLLAQLKMPGVGAGGPPTVADFDGDGHRDFASAVGDSYTIFTFTKTPAPAISVLWSVATADASSSRTGSSIFDFEGDGAAEVLYNDECYLRVYDGKTGAVRVQIASSSATAAQYPIAVDVDGDNHTELVAVSDDKYQLAGSTPGCPGYTAGEALRHGVFVYGDPENKWVRTRRIWNEHSYHVGNVGADGSIPTPEPASFGPSGYNTYRVSEQGNGTFNAPDLKLDLSLGTAGCPVSVVLQATVRNEGSLGVAAGVQVEVFAGMDATGTKVGAGMTTKALLPGEAEEVDVTAMLAGLTAPYAFYARVDGVAPGAVVECQEDNNAAGIGGVTCPTIN
jgi:hypothetical protein